LLSSSLDRARFASTTMSAPGVARPLDAPSLAELSDCAPTVPDSWLAFSVDLPEPTVDRSDRRAALPRALVRLEVGNERSDGGAEYGPGTELQRAP
jgi:hypothetical protein